jgi:hypothetical protein
MKRNEKIASSILAISFLFNIITLPKSPGSFYVSSHYYNLYLPNFGLGSDVSILPHAFKTLLAQYSLFKVLLEILQEDIIILHQSLYFLSPILAFFAFVLFFSVIPDLKENRIMLSSLMCLVVSWSPISLILGMATLFCLTKSTLKASIPHVISWMLSFLALAFYWHSAHLVFLFPIIFLLLLQMHFQLRNKDLPKEKAPKIKSNTLIVFLVISLFVWVFIRETPIFSRLFVATYFLDPLIISKGLFGKGSFIPLDYQYIFDFYISVSVLDVMRYITYLLTYLAIIFYSIHTIMVQNHDRKWIWALSLLFGSVSFQFLYYIATATIGPAPIHIFLIPFLLGICMVKAKNKASSARIKLIYGILFVLIMSSLALSASYTIYKDTTTSMEFMEDFDKYYSSSMWVANKLYEKNVLSDANTMGYMAIWCGKNKQYDIHPVYFHSIVLSTYDRLSKGTYNHAVNIIYNLDMYKKNLVFESLERWNKFKPLPPDIIQKNNLNILYNDGYILVLNK